MAADVLVVKIALGIVLAFVIIGLAQCAFALVLLGGISRGVPTVPVATARDGGGIGLTRKW